MTAQHPNYQSPVAWHDPYNGDTERLAADAAAYRAKLCPQPRSERKDIGR